MAYATNQFCWTGIISTQPDAAASFYSKALDWNVQEYEMGDMTGRMFAAGRPRGRSPIRSTSHPS